jgi:(2R)-3-sulfolactate dehydrogenase (NADP+)
MSLTVKQARDLAGGLLTAVGLDREDAEASARAIVLADVWGVGSHGLMRLPYYLERTRAGGYPSNARLVTVSDTGPVVALDGGGGLGHWQLWRASQLATERCRRWGIAAVAVGNSGHCGALGVYALPPLAAGCVALVFSNGPAVMPPWGGATPILSTSPLAAGIPARPRPAIIDLASSAVARGKLAAYARREEPLPDGWALDASGQPTNDARAALMGMLAPLGGAKGYALALLVESMSGGLVGPRLSADVTDMFAPEDAAAPQQIGHLIIVLDPARFDVEGGAGAQARFDELARRVTDAGGRLPGARRALPADIDEGASLPLDPTVEAELHDWAAKLGVVAATEAGRR